MAGTSDFGPGVKSAISYSPRPKQPNYLLVFWFLVGVITGGLITILVIRKVL